MAIVDLEAVDIPPVAFVGLQDQGLLVSIAPSHRIELAMLIKYFQDWGVTVLMLPVM